MCHGIEFHSGHRLLIRLHLFYRGNRSLFRYLTHSLSSPSFPLLLDSTTRLSARLDDSLEITRLLLLLWSVAGVLFSALALGTCEFLSIPGTVVPSNPDAGGATFTGLIGLFRIQERDALGNSYCVETPGYIMDQFGIYFQVAQLMGVVALTTGGVATIVLLMAFLMEMCCLINGLQYGLGIMFIVAAAAQGLTFMAIGDSACNNEFNCSTSTSSIWSIVATCLYFIAMVQSFAAPFPKDKICSRETCCQCLKKKENDDSESAYEGEEKVDGDDIEASPAAIPVDDDAAAIAAGVAAGGAAGAGVAAVVAADDDKEDKMENEDDISGEEAVGAGAVTAAAAVGEGDEEALDMTVLDEDNAALDREEAAAAAASAQATTTSSSVYESAKSEANQ